MFFFSGSHLLEDFPLEAELGISDSGVNNALLERLAEALEGEDMINVLDEIYIKGARDSLPEGLPSLTKQRMLCSRRCLTLQVCSSNEGFHWLSI